MSAEWSGLLIKKRHTVEQYCNIGYGSRYPKRHVGYPSHGSTRSSSYSMLVAKMMVSLDGMVWVSMPSDYARLPAN